MRRVHVLRLVSYVSDWLIIAAIVGLTQGLYKINGFRRQFSLNDETIKYDYGGPSTFGEIALQMISVGIPLILMALCTAVFERQRIAGLSRFAMIMHNINIDWIGLALSWTLSKLFTDVLKLTVGMPRPDFLARCKPAEGATAGPYGLVDTSICTQTKDHILRDGFRSFPSGHSSEAFSGCMYLTLYFAWRLALFQHRGYLWKWFIVLLPFMTALMCAVSRILDNRHHSWDVIAGSALGIATSVFAFYQYHPSLTDVSKRFPIRYSEDDEQEGTTSGSNTALNSPHVTAADHSKNPRENCVEV